jgi:hypothetical protein
MNDVINPASDVRLLEIKGEFYRMWVENHDDMAREIADLLEELLVRRQWIEQFKAQLNDDLERQRRDLVIAKEEIDSIRERIKA